MKFFTIAIAAGLLAFATMATNSAIAAEVETDTTSHHARNSHSPILGMRRHHRRHVYAVHYVRTSYQPTYYARPVEYRPYGLVPFFFGLSFPYRTW